MKKATKKSKPKSSQKKAVRDLDITPTKGGRVQGGSLPHRAGTFKP